MVLSFLIRPKITVQETRDASEEFDLLGTEDVSSENVTNEPAEKKKNPEGDKAGDGGPAGSPRPV
jgi:hypothetical protein